MSVTADELRSAVLESLKKQGYELHNGLIVPPRGSKDDLRALHRIATETRLSEAKPRLWRYEADLLQHFANGSEVDPGAIVPCLVPVTRRSPEEYLFRYATLQWSIPVSAGYGRRLRFLVIDKSNGKLIGLFGLSDPVFALKPREKWIGWSPAMRANNLYHVMNAHVLGAVPPYSSLLCGKLIAMLLLSNEVREAFEDRYANTTSIINSTVRKPYLSLITTTSAFGRSSIYNRLKANGVTYWQSIGYTQGTGEFHFSNGVFSKIRDYVQEHCTPQMKNAKWGKGFRNKREIIRCCLGDLGMSHQLLNHGVKREIFAAKLGETSLEFLRGESETPDNFDRSAESLAEVFMNRWLQPRAASTNAYSDFRRDSIRLWEPWSPPERKKVSKRDDNEPASN